MNYIFIYIIQSSLSLTIFYVFYLLLFKREAYLIFNRFYLLFAIFVSLLLPTFNFSIPELFFEHGNNVLITAPVYSLVEYSLGEVVIYGGSNEVQSSASNNDFAFFDILMLIYFVGVVFSLLKFSFRLIQLSMFFYKSKVLIHRGLSFIFTKSGTPVFSFFNYIFIHKELYENNTEVEKIIEHEKIHIHQKHSIDLIIAEIIIIIQWFNPLAYQVRKSIKENHEFIADNDVVAAYPDVVAYSKLLIENSSIINTNILTHNFSYSLLKRRLFMINKVKSPLRFSVKVLMALVALNLVFFACSGPVQQDDGLKDDVVFYENSATTIHPDSISLQTLTYPDDGYVVFLVSIGKDRNTKLNLFDKNGMLINSFFGGSWGPGTFGATWRPNDGGAIPAGNYSYKLIADEIEIEGIFSYKTENTIDKSIFTVVETMPEYYGGMKALSAYLSGNIHYPKEAKDKSIQGRVFVNFVIDTDGSVTDAKVLKGIGGGCDEEAVRVVSAMPNWKPGTQRGEAVNVSYNLPIKFVLDEKDADTIYSVVEVMPKFPGGEKKLMSYLGENISYPETAKNAKVSGRVFITFVIEKDGSVNEVKLLRGIGSGCDEEALRVISSMPKWKPGMQNGNAVRVQYNLPIKYALD